MAAVAQRRGFRPRRLCRKDAERPPRYSKRSTRMSQNSTRWHSRALTKRHKVALAGVATLGAAALAFSAVPSNADTTTSEAASSAKVAYSSEQLKGLQAGVSEQLADNSLQAQ